MKVLVITDKYPLEGFPSSSHWLKDHLTELASFAEVDVISFIRVLPRLKNLLTAGREWRYFQQLRKISFNQNISGAFKVTHRKVLVPPDSISWSAASAAIEAIGERFIEDHLARSGADVILVHWAHPCGALGLRVGRRHNIPVVVGNNEGLAFLDRYYSRRAFKLVYRIVRSAEFVLTQCGAQTQEILSYFPNKKVIQVPLGVRDRGIQNVTPSVQGKVNVVTVSRLDTPTKNIPLLLNALGLLNARLSNNIHLSIIGAGYQEVSLRRLAKRLGLSSFVRFYGWLPNDEVVNVLAQSDVFVLPSVYETFGLAFLEALSVGVPVIGWQHAGVLADLVGANAGVLPLKEVTAERVAEAIEILSEDVSLRKSLGEQGRKHVLENYSWGRHGIMLQDALKTVLERTTSGR